MIEQHKLAVKSISKNNNIIKKIGDNKYEVNDLK